MFPRLIVISIDVCKRIERQEEIERLINKVLLSFLYCSISEYQNQSSKKGITIIKIYIIYFGFKMDTEELIKYGFSFVCSKDTYTSIEDFEPKDFSQYLKKKNYSNILVVNYEEMEILTGKVVILQLLMGVAMKLK